VAVCQLGELAGWFPGAGGHAHAFLGQCPGHRQADAPAGAGDDRNLPDRCRSITRSL
jgi:hypothetical protein